MRTAARIYLFVGLLGIAAYVAVGGRFFAYELYGQAAWIAIAVGIWRNRPAKRAGWILFGIAQFTLATADFFYFTVYGGAPSFPSVSDWLYISGAAVFGASLLMLIGSRRARRDNIAAVGDAAVPAFAIGFFLWCAFFSGALGDGAGLARVVSISYPVMDLALLTVFIRALMERGRRSQSYTFVAAAVILLVLSDAWYVVPALTDKYVFGTWRDAGWLGSYLLAGVAALDPSMRSFIERRPGIVEVRRVAILGASLVLVGVAAIVQRAVTGKVDVYAYAGLATAMAVFISIRLVLLVRELEAARAATLESERRFRMVFERSPIGISVGRDGLMSETNPRLQEMLGYTGDELARMHYTEITHPDDRLLDVQVELDNGHRDSFSVDKRYVTKRGEVRDAHVHIALDVHDGLGISLIEDATERNALQEQLRQSQKMEAVGKLAGGIAHDFNNLMTAVLGYSDLILGKLEPGDVNREKIEAIREASVRASDLTRQLLAFSRRQMLQTSEIDLRDVVIRMEALLRRLIGEHIELRTAYGAEPVVVRADPTQIEQVVMNLAVNARDAMPGGGTLTIAAVSDGTNAVLSVADTGEGIDDATLGRVFEPFFTTKPQGAGSGLGLSTVHGIVGQSGGTVDVDTELGRGTVFTIRLPLVAPDVLPEPGPTATLVD